MDNNNKQHLLAYLGHEQSRSVLGQAAPPAFIYQSMLLGGDLQWRKAMKRLGHIPVAFAACAIADASLKAYKSSENHKAHIYALADGVIRAMNLWQKNPNSDSLTDVVWQKGWAFSRKLDVDGEWHDPSDYYAYHLSKIVSLCWSVVVERNNPRQVRWFGQAVAELRNHFHINESFITSLVSQSLISAFEYAQHSW